MTKSLAERFSNVLQNTTFNRHWSGVSELFNRFGEDDTGTPVFRGDADSARAAASARRSFLAQVLSEHRRSPAHYEVIEVPPGYEDIPRSNEPLDDNSAAAQMVQLEYQTASQQALLFGRVTDAVTCIVRRHVQRTGEHLTTETRRVDIALRHLKQRGPQSTFPWVAIIGTNHPELFCDALLSIRGWVGIGVNIRAAANFQPQRACKFGGEQGTVAGSIISIPPARPQTRIGTNSTSCRLV